MEFTVKSGNPAKQRSACVVVGIFESRRLSGSAEELDRASDGFISATLRRGDLSGKIGQTLLLYNVPGTLCDRVLLIGCGKEKELNLTRLGEISSRAARLLNDTASTEAVSYLTELPVKGADTPSKVRRAVEASEAALYRFDELKSKQDKNKKPLKKLTLAVPSRRDLAASDEALAIGAAVAAGVKLAKDLANRPANICTPAHLAEQARTLAKGQRKLKVNILEESDMDKLGMGALLSVSRGSRQPAKLIVLEYRGGPKNDRPVVLVGKGVTFDSGGISLKPGAAMDEMKYDMSGAASVLGTFKAVVESRLPVNLVGLIPATENLPDGQASKPGDIVTSMSGQTIEILNTDAEGRLILCDALTYAERYEPSAVIDIATLTGACIIALGRHPSGLLGNNQSLVNELLRAGKDSGDRAWELPLWDDYQEQLDSNFADMANIGGKDAGTITAACFLSRFTKSYRWAHLDIAGTAWKTGKKKGATGRPVPLLMQFLLNRCTP